MLVLVPILEETLRVKAMATEKFLELPYDFFGQVNFLLCRLCSPIDCLGPNVIERSVKLLL